MSIHIPPSSYKNIIRIISAFKAAILTKLNNSTNFGKLSLYFSISLYPGANLYGAYYEPLITLIGDKDSRVLQGNFYLTPQDIMDLDFRKIIKVGKHFYQLQKVDRFNPIANTTSYVSLFKILKDLQPTDYDFILLETDFYMLQENGVNKFYI